MSRNTQIAARHLAANLADIRSISARTDEIGVRARCAPPEVGDSALALSFAGDPHTKPQAPIPQATKTQPGPTTGGGQPCETQGQRSTQVTDRSLLGSRALNHENFLLEPRPKPSHKCAGQRSPNPPKQLGRQQVWPAREVQIRCEVQVESTHTTRRPKMRPNRRAGFSCETKAHAHARRCPETGPTRPCFQRP